MADKLSNLPNPGDADYPTNPELIKELEGERARLERLAKNKESQYAGTQAYLRDVRSPGYQEKQKAKAEEDKKNREKKKSDAAELQKLSALSPVLQKMQEDAKNAYIKNPTPANENAFNDASKKRTDLDNKISAITGKKSDTSATSNKPTTTQTTPTSTTGAATPAPVASDGVTTAGGAPGALTGNYNPTSGYGAGNGSQFTDVVNVPTFQTIYGRERTTSGVFNTQMSTTDAANRFLKAIINNTAEGDTLKNAMIKAGIAKANMDPFALADVYATALAKTSQAINAGVTGYSVMNAFNDLGKNAKSGSGSSSTNVNIQKKVYTEDDVRAIGNKVAQDMFGRMLTDDEIKAAHSTLNTASAKNPTKTVIRTTSGGSSSTSSSTTSGGVNEQELLTNQYAQTGESQAFTTNNVFDQAMRVLASRIG
jgi:hypothetical protein